MKMAINRINNGYVAGDSKNLYTPDLENYPWKQIILENQKFKINCCMV